MRSLTMNQGISLGINSMVTQLKEGSAQVEMLVAMGASRWEACRSLVRTACVVANFPTMNTLSVVGVVSIPGMMTGQIIGGSSPQVTAKLAASWVVQPRRLAMPSAVSWRQAATGALGSWGGREGAGKIMPVLSY